jgi:hypothetical protein
VTQRALAFSSRDASCIDLCVPWRSKPDIPSEDRLKARWPLYYWQPGSWTRTCAPPAFRSTRYVWLSSITFPQDAHR